MLSLNKESDISNSSEQLHWIKEKEHSKVNGSNILGSDNKTSDTISHDHSQSNSNPKSICELKLKEEDEEQTDKAINYNSNFHIYEDEQINNDENRISYTKETLCMHSTNNKQPQIADNSIEEKKLNKAKNKYFKKLQDNRILEILNHSRSFKNLLTRKRENPISQTSSSEVLDPRQVQDPYKSEHTTKKKFRYLIRVLKKELDGKIYLLNSEKINNKKLNADLIKVYKILHKTFIESHSKEKLKRFVNGTFLDFFEEMLNEYLNKRGKSEKWLLEFQKDFIKTYKPILNEKEIIIKEKLTTSSKYDDGFRKEYERKTKKANKKLDDLWQMDFLEIIEVNKATFKGLQYAYKEVDSFITSSNEEQESSNEKEFSIQSFHSTESKSTLTEQDVWNLIYDLNPAYGLQKWDIEVVKEEVVPEEDDPYHYIIEEQQKTACNPCIYEVNHPMDISKYYFRFSYYYYFS